MAALRGVLESDKGGQASRLSNHIIGATLSTWDGWVTVDLKKDGTFNIHVGHKGQSVGMMVATGNVPGTSSMSIEVVNP